MICPTCGSNKVVLHCEKCGNNWDDGRLEALEEVAKAADKLCGRSADGFTSVRWRELVEALKTLEGKG